MNVHTRLCQQVLFCYRKSAKFLLLPYDVDQYYNKENSVLFFTSYNMQTTSSRLYVETFRPEDSPLSSYKSAYNLTSKFFTYGKYTMPRSN